MKLSYFIYHIIIKLFSQFSSKKKYTKNVYKDIQTIYKNK